MDENFGKRTFAQHLAGIGLTVSVFIGILFGTPSKAIAAEPGSQTSQSALETARLVPESEAKKVALYYPGRNDGTYSGPPQYRDIDSLLEFEKKRQLEINQKIESTTDATELYDSIRASLMNQAKIFFLEEKSEKG